MMQTLCTLRRWLRGLEPQVRTRLECSALARFQPWLERRALFRFQRQPLARGVAAGMFCGLIPGPLQIPGTLLVCAWLRGNIVAGGVATADGGARWGVCATQPLDLAASTLSVASFFGPVGRVKGPPAK